MQKILRRHRRGFLEGKMGWINIKAAISSLFDKLTLAFNVYESWSILP